MDFTLADVRNHTIVWFVGCQEQYRKRKEMEYPDCELEWNDDDDVGHLYDHIFIEELENNLWRLVNVVDETVNFEIENIKSEEVVRYVHRFSGGLLIDQIDYPSKIS
jgi:hypothetical protein